eukprot:CFRG3575T1
MSVSRFQLTARRALNARNVLVKRAEAVVPADAARLETLAKGDWKTLSIADKQALYRAEYTVTRAEAGLSMDVG